MLKKKRFICSFEVYNDKATGEEKKLYHRIGEIATIAMQDGREFDTIKLYSMPNVDLKIFDDKPKENNAQQQQDNGFNPPNNQQDNGFNPPNNQQNNGFTPSNNQQNNGFNPPNNQQNNGF